MMHTKEKFLHGDVFSHLKNVRFSLQEAAEHLEVSMPTFRRYVQSGKVIPAEIVERSQLFFSDDFSKI